MNYTSIIVNTGSANVGSLVGFNIPSTLGFIEKGKIYTLQFKCRALSNSYILDNIYIGNQKLNSVDIRTFESVLVEDVEFKLCYITFVSNSKVLNPNIKICKAMSNEDIKNADIFEITDISLAFGRLAKYDVNVGDFMLLRKEVNTKLQQLSDMILMNANSEAIDELTGKISKALGQIQVSAGNIELKVDNDGIISAINMSKEGIKINTNLLDLTGDLDLQGQFKCWASNSNKKGAYLYSQGAMVRGYKDIYQEKPTFASGLWYGMGNSSNTPLGYVSVGLTNAVDSDNNGCLWMSPVADSANNWYGTTLSFSRRLDSTGEYVRSAIDFNASGKLEFKCFDNNKQTSGYAGYIFDAGISCYSLTAHDLYARNCRTRQIYPEQSGYYSIGNASARYTDAFIDTVSTTNTEFKIGTVKTSGAWEQYGALSINSKDGYVHPANTGGALSLGKSTNRFHMLYSVGNVNVSSDERLKTDIHYLDEPMSDKPVVIDNRVERNIHITSKDMYDFVRDDLRLASYRYNANIEKGNTSVDYGFIAQDILYTKVGSEIVQLADKYNLNSELSYNQGNYISVLAGALQQAITKIELLEQEIKSLKGGA